MKPYRDLDYFDAGQDLLVTGEDLMDPEWPYRPLKLSAGLTSQHTVTASTPAVTRSQIHVEPAASQDHERRGDGLSSAVVAARGPEREGARLSPGA